MKPFLTLIRREFWEHRGLWIAPLAVAAVLLIMVLLGGAVQDGIRIDLDEIKLKGVTPVSAEQAAKLFGLVIAVLGLPILITMIIVVFFYVADSLYAERKDRSILFWKSLPVSDAATVWSKVATALLATPLITWAIGVVSVTLGFLILKMRLGDSPVSQFAVWDTGIWLQVQAVALINLLVAALWYSPLVGYMLAVSAWARRSVFMWIVLPPLALTWAEELLLDKNYLAAFLGRRLTGFFDFIGRDADRAMRGAGDAASRAERLSARFDSLTSSGLLISPELWLGVAAAVGLVFVAIRLRRYRDDT